jgi:hypothetical protein
MREIGASNRTRHQAIRLQQRPDSLDKRFLLGSEGMTHAQKYVDGHSCFQ